MDKKQTAVQNQPKKYVTSRDSAEVARRIRESSERIMRRNAEAYRGLANR